LFSHKKHIFFDLDHTLWDYERNCKATIIEIYEKYALEKRNIQSAELLYEQFLKTNYYLWDLYDSHQITSDELRHRRFREIFTYFGNDDHSICDKLNQVYLEINPKKPYLIDGALDILNYLAPKYTLHIITNGFEDFQNEKMNASGISLFFTTKITSEKAKARKPETRMFEYALNITEATVNECIMIGDNYETDIKGAKNIGMDYFYYNPENKKCENKGKSEIKHLLELKTFL
jgi:YjjG family noncanonical pyrimidine nucleotidase